MGNILKADTPAEALWRDLRHPGEVFDLGVPLRQALGLQRLIPATGKPVLGRREGILLGVFALVLHGAVLYWLSQRPEPVLPEVPVEIPPMTIEFTSPPPPPEPVIEPPPPVVEELAVKPPPPKPVPPKPQPPKPKPVPKPVEQPPQPQPPKAETPPTPPAPPAPKPVTETPPSANAAYLKNPAPEYPSLAQRRGWEGTVLLRVRVLASGKPAEIQVQKSSGRDLLDQAAIRAVKRWSFVPAKRGDQAQEGWVTVPLDFRLN
ncbi:energy transducer TonB [Aquipseudomonas campi]